MPQLDFYFDTKKVNEDIANWRDLEIEVNFEDETGQGTVKSGSLEFVGALADKINNWNTQGMVGGPGIFEAPPFRIEVCGSGNVVFEGGINVADCSTSYECDKVVAPLRSQSIDFINDRASSFSFAWLASLPINSPGRITQFDYLNIPYVINSIPDGVNVMVAGMSLYMMLKELNEMIDKTTALVAELTGSVVPTVGVGVTTTVGAIVADIAKLGFYLAYLAFMIKAIIDLLQMVMDNLIQPVKFKKGMRVRDLFVRACAYLGIDFSSTLLSSPIHYNDVIIPRKTQKFNQEKNFGKVFGIDMDRKDYDDSSNPTSTGFFEGTFADLILIEEQRLNAEIRIIGNTLHFETKEFFAKFANYTLPNIQRRNADPHGTNACELSSNYIISYSLDDQDTNTYDDYRGTSCQMQLSPAIVINKKNILLKNITEITLQYALAKRKENLNVVEKIVSIIYDIVNEIYTAVTKFINGVIKKINDTIAAVASLIPGGVNLPKKPDLPKFPPNPMGVRIGMMMLSSDFIGVQKLININPTVLVSKGFPARAFSLNANNVSITSARALMDEFHFTNFAVRKITSTGKPRIDHNQWLIYTDKEIPFCCGDYLSLLDNNFIKTYDQKTAKVKSIVWNPYKNTARITYRVKEQYTNNLNQKYIIDGKIP